MKEFWVYDWEVYYNFCCVTFIHSTTPKYLIDAYIEVDILYLAAKSKYNARIKTTADYKNATGYNGSLVGQEVEMKTDKRTCKTYRKVAGGWESLD